MSNHEYAGQLSPPAEASLEAALDDVSVELSRVEALDTPVSSVVQLDQNLPELGYYEAELRSLRSSLLEGRDR
jgi:hypothetical protein